MKKVLVVFGTRPEAIKLAPVISRLKAQGPKIETIVCVTAQHREMLDQVLRIFEIHPDYDLGIMKANQDLFDVTSNALMGLKDVVQRENPDIVVVQGDTTTAFAAGLAAFYSKILVGHVEAGLRTYNKYSPFPEEKNRHLLSAITDYHFAPTDWSKSNLLKEGISEAAVWVTGNTVIDALMMISEKQRREDCRKKWIDYFENKFGLSKQFNGKRIILVTGHRRENFGEGFENICLSLKEIASARDDVVIIYPVHLNPNVQKPVRSIINDIPNIHLISPLDYEPFVFLMRQAYIILTDSGGIQEEAPSLGKPVLVMRNTTERPEGIRAGIVKLVGTDKNSIVNSTLQLLDDPTVYGEMSEASNPYGDGKAAERIVEVLIDKLQGRLGA